MLSNQPFRAAGLSVSAFLILLFLPFTATSQTWELVGETLFGAEDGDQFGTAVELSADGSRLAVSSLFADEEVDNSGSVKIFEEIDGQWVQLGQTISGFGSDDYFGYMLSFNDAGDVLAIGIRRANEGNYGAVAIYEFNGTIWVSKGSVVNGIEESEEFSAFLLEMNGAGDTWVAGAWLYDGSQTNTGRVACYHWQDDDWVQKGQDLIGETESEYYGVYGGMDGSGDIIAFGRLFDDFAGEDAGAVDVMEWNGQEWVQKGSTLYGENEDDNFGVARISANGNRLSVGARYNDDGANNAGHVRTFEWDGSDWVKIGEDLDGQQSLENFRWTRLNHDGTVLAVAAPFCNLFDIDEGRVQMYQWQDGWVEMGEQIQGEIADGYFGGSISLSQSGYRIASSASEAYLIPGDARGRVEVYDWTGPMDINEQDETVLNLYPNPSSGHVSIAMDKWVEDAWVNLYDMHGSLVSSSRVGTGNYFEVRFDLAPGLYALQVIGEDGFSKKSTLVSF